ncbi:NADPH-dependent FMN reductase [Ottowia sp. VDI28]|uniref:NADPH-dependent FMN reductase n=1 Tax=Ottowia sp. VDI28 TaxID=3133968 RepID=UPI003C2B9B90
MKPNRPLNLLALNGSLRNGSFNGMVFACVKALAPPALTIKITSCAGIPLYCEDLEKTCWPDAVLTLAQRIREADGILIASPEYNFSISGVLKNTLDWLSRLPRQPFANKPVAVLSATQGAFGGARHQYELRKILGALDARTLPRPEVLIGHCHTKFDADGQLSDDQTRSTLEAWLAAVSDWVALLSINQEQRCKGDIP